MKSRFEEPYSRIIGRGARALICVVAIASVALVTSVALAVDAPHVFFKNLKDGATVKSPVKVEMGVEGMTVAKAGSTGATEGHFHLLIDTDPIEKGSVIPADATHLHFGQAQTETMLELPPGKHRVTLQFADGAHRSFGKELAASVTVNVVP